MRDNLIEIPTKSAEFFLQVFVKPQYIAGSLGAGLARRAWIANRRIALQLRATS